MLTDTGLPLQAVAKLYCGHICKAFPEWLALDQAQDKLTIEVVSGSHGPRKELPESNMGFCSPKGYPESWLSN